MNNFYIPGVVGEEEYIVTEYFVNLNKHKYFRIIYMRRIKLQRYSAFWK